MQRRLRQTGGPGDVVKRRDMKVLNRDQVLDLLGDPNAVVQELHDFRKTAEVFSSRRANLIAKYAKRWIAVHEGEVVAHGRSLDDVLTKVDRSGIERKRVLIRYVDRTLRKLIL